ncbi:UDP-N-acetylglucosamine transporter [Schistosoma japonicum]|uniref:UDP-N-acetylglucosamine transporter n=1 Tax=Schistosoma japonicum TaxID=6182 RepID=C1LDX8_SCHJA|nr:UDP-galactose translocator [Schistosoma japonicum]KAH8859378.1 UDP-galactose translocator [Schistosoma japonicum]KAH8859379.1 UDP-galactose translocator [Schistosoma japonicum]KAH8859380.1 UDP-galactose translocator [Schistosoma japonicum]TNN08625.1 UDP-N-acetylglucosamine transporter [Schistosoma japonicum]
MFNAVTMKYLSLFILVFQNLLYILCMRHARSRTTEMFNSSSLVIMSECLKFLISLSVLSFTGDLKRFLKLVQCYPMDVLMSFIPAIIYVIQNRFLIAALSNLDAVTFQVAYQLKLFTTALFSMLVLQKPISTVQWFALVLLFIGVATVETPVNPSKSIQQPPIAYNPPLGLFCAVCAAILSGLGCVSFEKLLKNTNKSIWHRNIELSFASIITGIPVQLLTDWNDIRQNGYFHDFDWFVWIVVSLHAFGGILVALVVKYANNILKAFACCVSIVLSCAISVIIFGIHLSNSFIFGALTVIVSSILYSAYPPKVHVS